MRFAAFILNSLFLSLSWAQALPDRSADIFPLPDINTSNEAFLLILGTNDIHGHFDSGRDFVNQANPHVDPLLLGGADWFKGYVKASQDALTAKYTTQGKLFAQMVLLDAGDAAQGTLLSNPSEGVLAGKIMNLIGYTAAVPGNHAYDFGPKDPPVDPTKGDQAIDQCPPLAQANGSCQPLETLELLRSTANRVPFLAANVYIGKPENNNPYFGKAPYQLVPFLGRNVAIIGIENSGTPSTTYAENVSTLSFSSGVTEVKTIARMLKSQNKADIVLVVMHEGDTGTEQTLGKWIQAVQAGERFTLIDGVVGGHSHVFNQNTILGIPYVQSYWGGKYFGAMGFTMTRDASDGKLRIKADKLVKAGIPIIPEKATLWGQPIDSDKEIGDIIAVEAARAKKDGSVILSHKLKSSFSTVEKRTSDSQIGNMLADAMREKSSTDLAIIGSGDVRVGIEKDPASENLIYSQLFEVIPKNLQLVALKKVPLSAFLDNLKKSIASCGIRGALQISGFKVYFTRNCDPATNPKLIKMEDHAAEIVQVVQDDGTSIYKKGDALNGTETLNVSTSDFILTGGAGYGAFKAYSKDPANSDDITYVGALRTLTSNWISAKASMRGEDYPRGRYINCSENPKDEHGNSLAECQQ